MKYIVTVSYATDCQCEVEAETEDEAETLAKDMALETLRNHSACTDGFTIESIEKIEPEDE